MKNLNRQELATVLAALRYYQQQGMGDPANRSDEIHAIATDLDKEISMDATGIDALCEKLNAPEETPPSCTSALLDRVATRLSASYTKGIIRHPRGNQAVIHDIMLWALEDDARIIQQLAEVEFLRADNERLVALQKGGVS